ncbi:MAG: carnitine-CoA ligase [Solirubrobacteraceae bacterium]|jgi:crotonobetaine/carnitine-CoA ligase|nr:carnitine-CoA ligase [Solirubrobacteraceae bacterium]
MLEDLVLPTLIRDRASAEPERVFLQHVDGPQWTYAECHREALRWAAAFERLEVSAADPVVVMLPNTLDACAVWLALGWIRAYDIPMNTAYRGRILASLVAHTEARVAVVASEFLELFLEVQDELPSLERMIVIGEPVDAHGSTARWQVSYSSEVLDETLFSDADPPKQWDIGTILHTSGTTGMSKGVLVPWAQLHSLSVGTIPLDEMDTEDAWYSPFPLFHASGKMSVYAMALVNGRTVLRDRFSTSEYWDDVKRFKCTTSLLMGTTAAFLGGQTASPSDADNPLRFALVAPLPADPRAYGERFGIRVCTVFNMTEISSPIWTAWDVKDPQSCGHVREGFECRVVDENDIEVPHGEVGELVVRSREPWTLMAGYYKRPDATAQAWRNLWFHTGDVFRRDDEGSFYYLDRKKDSIRRRGENISSLEVEREVDDYPGVLECAVVGVPSELVEEEVKVTLVSSSETPVKPHELIEFLTKRLPSFMVPRYVEILEELPKTPTEKVRKEVLRESGTAGCWDREREGAAV